jgi:hypothetical protein
LATRLSFRTHAPGWSSASDHCLSLFLAALFAVFMTACSGGSSSSSPAATSVAVAPVITMAPATPQTVTVGDPAIFTVVASGTAPLSYQWKKGTTNMGTDADWFALTSVQTADAGSYTVTVTNDAGSVTSSPATLTVSPVAVAPVITTYPANTSVTVGSSASFSVVASGSATLHYQWQQGSTVVGADSATYDASALTAATR